MALAFTSTPQFRRVEPVDAAGPARGFVHQVLRPTGTIAALAIPQANENELLRAEADRGLQHPHVVALVSIVTIGKRSELIGRDMQCCSRFRGKETGMPV